MTTIVGDTWYIDTCRKLKIDPFGFHWFYGVTHRAQEANGIPIGQMSDGTITDIYSPDAYGIRNWHLTYTEPRFVHEEDAA